MVRGKETGSVSTDSASASTNTTCTVTLGIKTFADTINQRFPNCGARLLAGALWPSGGTRVERNMGTT